VTSIFTNSTANSVPVSSGINLEADMAKKIIRTKQRVKGECWYGLSKLAAFRWYMNRIENLLLSIYAEHPDQKDPNLVKDEKDIYTSIWEVLKHCETDIINIKTLHKASRPPGLRTLNDCGCWTDDDCGTGWWCNRKTGMCEPDPPDGSQNRA
jgi:hypothetical protein